MKILLLDNYDSFTYNIVQYVERLGYDIDVFRNDKITLDEVEQYDKIILSPGPGLPSDAGILLPLIERYGTTKSIFGICLGMQAIGEVYGAKLFNLSKVFHGVASEIDVVADDYIFQGMGARFTAGRYHSWCVSQEAFPQELEITALDADQKEIMALSHRSYDVRGVQFHPESVLTPEGIKIIENWLKR